MNPATYADFEIGLHGAEAGDYAVELRFRSPDGSTDQPPLRSKAEIDLAALGEAGGSYGRVLTQQVFRDPELIRYFRESFIAAQAAEAGLRVRLFIGPTAAKLHGLRWELLERPWPTEPPAGQPEPLSTTESIVFSRYLSSHDWRPVQLRPKDELRALVVVANPANLVSDYHMAEVKVADEVRRAKQGLGAIPTEEVTGPGTLLRMMDKLRDGFDILYLVCHGGLDRANEPRLWLERDDGQAAVTAGGELVVRLADLWLRPRLVVLASCQGAGRGDEIGIGDDAGVLAAIGPKLAEAGLPAVLAMQGRVLMATVEQFLPVFFRELARDGRIDRAVAVARREIRSPFDAWKPALFARTSHGRIWYVPGVSPSTGERFDGWNGLITAIRLGACTPILGSGLLEGLVGSMRELARRWAEAEDFAMAPYQREDLPQVTQYFSVKQGGFYPPQRFGERLRDEVARRLGVEPGTGAVDDLLHLARDRRREAGRSEPHGRIEPHEVLARLPFRVYITTNADDQLRLALADAGKDPRVEMCRWHDRPEYQWPASVFDRDENYTPGDTGHPLVYHLYGRLQAPDSLVLTEDDYFDYLIRVHMDPGRIPLGIKKTLLGTQLLFLGFRMDDWDFRVLFRSILAQGDKGLSRKYNHVAVQIEPEEGRNADPQEARSYLQTYFRNSNIHIYWGSVEEFVRDLWDRGTKANPPLVARS